MGTSSETTVENVAIFAIKGTLPLPIGWSRPLVSRTNEHGGHEFAVANSQDLIWRNIDSLTQFEEEGFLTTLNKGMEIHSSEIGNSWILYVNESLLSELPATVSILQLFREETQKCSQQQNKLDFTRTSDQGSQSIRLTVIPKSRLDTFRSKAFKALFDDIVFCQLSRSTDCNLLHQASLMLVDLASSETEGANGIALSLSLLFETDKAAQAQHWLNLVCTKFGFSSKIEEWQLRSRSILAASSSRMTEVIRQNSNSGTYTILVPIERKNNKSKRRRSARNGLDPKTRRMIEKKLRSRFPARVVDNADNQTKPNPIPVIRNAGSS